jgi:methylmalonic aciduria homocystinuria type C protein
VKVDVSYDYEMLPSRKPKFLAQSAAHVAGAVYYYQRSDIPDHPWGEKVSDWSKGVIQSLIY